MERLYFAHPVNTYDTHWEALALECIYANFSDNLIENPNQLHHQKAYMESKEKTGNGMTYFYDEVMQPCNAGTVALSYLDGKIGAGVAAELVWTIKKERKVSLIEIDGYDFEEICSIGIKEEKLLLDWWNKRQLENDKIIKEKIGNELVLSIEETRKRTWIDIYKTFRSYEEAHLV